MTIKLTTPAAVAAFRTLRSSVGASGAPPFSRTKRNPSGLAAIALSTVASG